MMKQSDINSILDGINEGFYSLREMILEHSLTIKKKYLNFKKSRYLYDSDLFRVKVKEDKKIFYKNNVSSLFEKFKNDFKKLQISERQLRGGIEYYRINQSLPLKDYYIGSQIEISGCFNKKLFSLDEFVLNIYDGINKTRIYTSYYDLETSYIFPSMFLTEHDCFVEFTLNLLMIDLKKVVYQKKNNDFKIGDCWRNKEGRSLIIVKIFKNRKLKILINGWSCKNKTELEFKNIIKTHNYRKDRKYIHS